ncbi:MAG: hypothetical protein Q7T84_13850 [Phenylobacterium sp.]|uniref:hypothetical protein n=1 Tax=Phenylobacterium sp. TaxID=1871053 RepID=UPI0027205EC6|nr:hypothetical protein [Phenylobacterium sp.]MDO9432378.1 hypothetical protein [Phenylobacterium sp.]
MSARTSFLVWWGLPILCAGLGALLANYANLDGGGGIGRTALLLVVGYFAAVGFLAVIFRVRQSQVLFDERDRFDKPVEAAMVAMCVPILAAGIWFLVNSFIADLGPSRSFDGRLRSVDSVGAFGRTYAIDLDETGYPLLLQCRLQRNCGSPVPLLQLKPGTPIQAEMLDGRVIGLKVAGQQYVDAGQQRTMRLLIGGGLLALLALYTAAFAAVSIRLLFGREEEPDESLNTVWIDQ